MAPRFTLLSVLWIVVILVARTTAAAPESAGKATEPLVDLTTKPPVNATTKPPVDPTTKPPVDPTTKPPVDPQGPCDDEPCKDGSTCQARQNNTFVCLCLPGTQYNDDNKICETLRVFPGALQLNKPFKPAMNDPKSKEFAEVADVIVTDMKLLFVSHDDITIVVLKLEGVSALTRAAQNIKATVDIAFPITSEVTKETVTNTLKNPSACDKCTAIKDSTFTAESLCKDDAYDKKTVDCKDTEAGLLDFSCKKGYVPSEYTTRVCVARCPVDEILVGDKCEKCTFGYSGVHCQDSWKLTLVIVGSVLGGLLVIAIVLVGVFATKSPKKGSKKSKKAGIESAYESHPSVKTPLSNTSFANGQARAGGNGAANFANSAMPRIPRATANNSWNTSTNLEMTPSNSRQNLIPAGRNTNNPYSQNRPQVNPYAASQGRTNPYFSDDNGRRFN